MSKATASTVVLLTGAVLVVLALLTPDQGARYKKIWAAGLLTAGLGVAADFVPEVVGPFAALVIIAAVAKNPGLIGRFTAGGAAATAGSTRAAPTGIIGPQGTPRQAASPPGVRGPFG